MHIVHLMASPFVGGPERQVLGVARHLPAPFRTTFLSFAEHGLARPFIEEARREGFAAIELRANAPRLLKCIGEVARELRERKADLLCTSGYKPDLIGWRAARRAGVPVVAIAHGWTAATFRVRCYEALDRRALRCVDAVVAVSQAQAAKLRRAGVSETRITTILNAIGDEAFAPAEPEFREALLKQFPSPPRLIVGAAGRLSREKDIALLIDAAAQVAAQQPDVGFVVLGEGPLRAALSDQIGRLGLRGRFILPGFRPDVAKYLPHFDVAVLSSKTEGMPVVLLEAFAAGVPMVATAVGGIPEVLEDGKSGYLVRSGDATALAGRIAELLRDDGKRLAMGRHAQEHVRRGFSCQQQAGRYADLFLRLGATRAPLLQ
jgi:glycosyltransferase involved in cell wall biosynthesis